MNTHATLLAFLILYNILYLLLGIFNTLAQRYKVGLRHRAIVRRSWIEHFHEWIASYVLVHLEKFVDLLFEAKVSKISGRSDLPVLRDSL